MTEIQKNESMTELIKNFEYICWLTKETPRMSKTIKTLIVSMIL